MRITILSITATKSKDNSITPLIQDYEKRLNWRVEWRDIVSKKQADSARQKTFDADLLRGAIPKGALCIALDEKGKNLPSQEFSGQIQNWQNRGESHLCFLIGGADGLDAALLKETSFHLSFGKLTWPHRLVKLMLIEQIYRAQSILDGHPYHRE